MGSKSKQPAARLGDIDTGHPPAPPTPIITASGNVFINGRPAARKGDMLVPHHPGVRIITEGSGSVLINGKPAARITDAINCGGKIIVGSGNVLIGDSPPSGSPLAPGEWDEYIAASSTAKDPSPYQDQQMRADIAVKYHGKAGASASWQVYYSDMSAKDRPAPSSIQDQDQCTGLERANRARPATEPVLPGPEQQQIIDGAGQQMQQAIKNLAEGEMVTPEILNLAGTMLQAGAQSNRSNQSTGSSVPNKFKSIYEQAPAAKLEIDSMADEIAEMFGGQVSKAPIKSQERAIQKIMNDYGGDATRIKDLARNTIIVSPDKMDAVVAELVRRGANVKIINGTTDPLGYSGANSTMKTQSGIFGEVQVNTPAMIYAKEPEPLARVLLGDDLYDSIASKSGIAGGQGHKLYEQWRILPAADPARITIEAQSRAYYNAVRSSIYGN